MCGQIEWLDSKQARPARTDTFFAQRFAEFITVSPARHCALPGRKEKSETFEPAGSLNVMWRKSVLPALSLLLLNQLAPRADGIGRRGALIIAGGGGTSRESFGPGVLEQFMALAGGPGANFV
jgi:hypothetical protein